MTQSEYNQQRPTILRFTRTMAAPLRQQFKVDVDDSDAEFTQLLEQAERRLQKKSKAQGAS